MWTTVARLGLAWWFFGNLYEAIVDVPQLVLDRQAARSRHILAPGSPVRYYAPTLLPALAGLTARAIQVGRAGRQGRATAAAAAVVSAAGITAYLVRTVNLRLLGLGGPVGADEGRRLVRTWHMLNLVRLAAHGVAWWSLR